MERIEQWYMEWKMAEIAVWIRCTGKECVLVESGCSSVGSTVTLVRNRTAALERNCLFHQRKYCDLGTKQKSSV